MTMTMTMAMAMPMPITMMTMSLLMRMLRTWERHHDMKMAMTIAMLMMLLMTVIYFPSRQGQLMKQQNLLQGIPKNLPCKPSRSPAQRRHRGAASGFGLRLVAGPPLPSAPRSRSDSFSL